MTDGSRTEREVVERVASTLLVIGAAVGALGIGAWAFDLLPPVPEWMLRLAVYKLTLASGAGLMVAGAVLRRQMRAAARRDARLHAGMESREALGAPSDVPAPARRERVASGQRGAPDGR